MTTTLERRPTRARRGLVVLVVVVLLAVAAIVLLGRSDTDGDEPLSITSTRPDGARALARLLDARGTNVREVDSLADARGGGDARTVFVLASNDYAPDRLAALAADTSGPLVLLAPGNAALAAVRSDLVRTTDTLPVTGTVAPGCDDPAAAAAGPVAFSSASTYDGPTPATVCYTGAFARDGRVSVLGDPGGLVNARLDATGTAALALDVLGTTSELVIVRPGADADTGPTGSVWSALPDHAETAASWLLGVGLLVVLWRGRRLGTPVAEPLPVVVRADEIVRGRARLYERTGDTARAAALLRHATTTRLRRQLTLPPGTPPPVVAHEAARALGAPVPEGLLAGPPPVDGDDLLRLARDLADLEDRLRTVGGRAGWTS
ncbi:DUF4350 domain-containing protein [Jatrophihabitans sp. YIM 134969]